MRMMLARLGRGREWRVAVFLALCLGLAGCGGGKIGDLLKDSPTSPTDQPAPAEQKP
jgi:hypothetical protein